MADDATTGYGQQDPSDSASDHNVLLFTIKQTLARTRTMTLVKIKAVTNTGALAAVGFVDVQPIVKQLDGQSNSTPHGTIFNVPYTRIQGGKNAVIIDPEVDDIGWMAVADRDISAVKDAKAEANPGSMRKFDLADGVYLGGILNAQPEQYVRFHSGGIEFVDKNANNMTFGPDGISINGVIFDRTSKVVGDLKATGEVTAKFGTGASVGLTTHWTLSFNTPPKPGS
jgi:hypothetical protein